MLLTPGSVPGYGPTPADPARHGAMANPLASMPDGSADRRDSVADAAIAMGARPAPRGTATPPSAKFKQALARLDELLRHPSPAGTTASERTETLVKRMNLHRAALAASTSALQERQIIELLLRLFDGILADPQVPAAFATVVARLQTSALRVALRDPKMLNSTQHTVWRPLDCIGEAGAGHPQANDPRAAALIATCRTLAEQLARAPAPDATLYCRARTQLDTVLDEPLRIQLRAAQPQVKSLQLVERRDVLVQQLTHRQVEQMVPIRTSPGIRRFVTGSWARVLAESMLRDGEQGEATRGYIKLVDELLWSLKLPDHPQSRQRLLSLLPSMLQRLRAGMALVNLAAAEQAHVLDELVAIHTQSLRPGVRGADADALTPEQMVQLMRDEVLPPSTGNGAFGDSVMDLGSMETVPVKLMPKSLSDEPAKHVDALRPADRLSLLMLGRWARVQLLWRSDQGRFFPFAGETSERTHSVTHRALEKPAAAGLLQPLEARSLVQRALDNVARELVRPG